MRRIFACFVAMAALSACSDPIGSTRTSIRSWCESTPKYCDVNAVK